MQREGRLNQVASPKKSPYTPPTYRPKPEGPRLLTTVQKKLQHEALMLVFWQLIITILLSLAIVLIKGLSNGYSTFLGAAAYVLPNFIFAWRVFSNSGSRISDRFMINFLLGEFTKLVLSAIFFILIVKYLPVNMIFVMLGYALAIFSFWFVCGWHFGRGKSSMTINQQGQAHE